MRLPLWIGMLSAVGTLVPAACAQDAKPDQPPAAPANPAAVPAPAANQVDPVAKKALEESADALKNMGPCTFTIEMRTEGLGPSFKFESTMKVKMIRGKTPGTSAYQMLGDFTSPGAQPEDSKVNAVLFEGKSGEWIDEAAKTLFIRPLKGVKSPVLSKCMTPNKAFEVMLLDAEPFKGEINALQLEMQKAEAVDGEACQVVKATLDKNASAFRFVYISALDKLPRKYVQVMGKPGGKQQTRSFVLKDFKDAKLTLDDLHLKAPAGFKVDKVDAPPPPPPQADPPKKDVGNDKADPGKEGKMTPEEKEKEKEKQKKEAAERTRAKIPPDPNVIPTTVKPGKN